MADTDTTEHDVIVLEDADGNEVEFAMLGIVELEGEGQFALLAPTWQLELDEDAQLEVYIFRYLYNDEDGSEDFGAVEDDGLVERVGAIAEAQLFTVEEGETEPEAEA
ncbi:MAG: DUF1292 domain-containing protein [Proteobacteria bacterium]|nr:DUF1292 domain-containing protein [Pseudomonadota bacterium]MCP4920806.1 DUF1292 domain-containing protein [Pseudomonadota bacterium]